MREADCCEGGLSSSKEEEEDMMTEDAGGVQLCEAEARETEDNAGTCCGDTPTNASLVAQPTRLPV